MGTTVGTGTTFGKPVLLKGGEADNYHGVRWGDYSAARNDPLDFKMFWLTQEWALQGTTPPDRSNLKANLFGTQVAAVRFP